MFLRASVKFFRNPADIATYVVELTEEFSKLVKRIDNSEQTEKRAQADK